MWSIFDAESLYGRAVTKIMQIIYLNILWLLFCLPVVTIGASTTALYYVTMKMARKEEGYITKDFMRSFRQNLRQGTVIWIMVAGGGFILLQDFRYFSYLNSMTGMIGTILLTILYSLVALMIFPVLSRFKNSTGNFFKLALYIALRHIPSGLALAAMLCIIGYGIYTSVTIMLFAFICGGAVIAYCNSLLLNRILNLYITEEQIHE